MVRKTPDIKDRKLRADARRNRERILEVAQREFMRVGADASLEDIAKKAGVGPGTLYRHFPVREELLVAVYRSDIEKLAATERRLAESKLKRCGHGYCCSSTVWRRSISSPPC
jgi:AcrR family transcriptional regulator